MEHDHMFRFWHDRAGNGHACWSGCDPRRAGFDVKEDCPRKSNGAQYIGQNVHATSYGLRGKLLGRLINPTDE